MNTLIILNAKNSAPKMKEDVCGAVSQVLPQETVINSKIVEQWPTIYVLSAIMGIF